MITRLFFDGAISADLPQNYLDLSESYLVPDNQCVYSNDKGSCFIIEFVQPGQISNEKCAKFYYDDIAQCNEGVADDATPQEIPPLYSGVNYSAMIRGNHTSKKSGTRDYVRIFVSLAVYRFQNTDMLISLTSEVEDEQNIWFAVIKSLRLDNIGHLLPKQ